MNVMKRVFTCTLIILIIALTVNSGFGLIDAHAMCQSGNGVSIDVFTQKAPFDGRGSNQSSDLFGPQETVDLYALVTVNNIAEDGELVTFVVTGPTGLSNNTIFYLEGQTNSTGIAEAQFTLQIINQTQVFGKWTVVGYVQIDGGTYSDILTFQVNWLIEFVSIRTLNENLTGQQSFGKDGYVGIEVGLKDNAEVGENATVEITIFDVAKVPINTVTIPNFTVPPNGETWYIYSRLHIETYALVGDASVVAVALTQNNTPYCPDISTNFLITIQNPLTPNFVDAAIFLGYVPAMAEPDQLIAIPMTVRNQGTVTLDNLNARLYINGSLLDSETVASLDSYSYKAFSVVWNTTGLPFGNYAITASVQTFPNEADLSDNSYSFTTNLTTPSTIGISIHDIQVTNVTCSKNKVNQGETIDISVTVANNGNFTESTNVSIYYDNNLIQTQPLTGLTPCAEQTLFFHWNTTNVPVGSYQIKAMASPVPGETNIANNTFQDGTVTINSPVSPPPSFPSLTYLELLLLFMGIAIIASLAFLIFLLAYRRRRRRKKPSKKPDYVVLVHPHL